MLTFIALSVPGSVSADAILPNLGYAESLGLQSVDLLDILIGLVVTLALLFFFWGLAIFIFNAGDDDARKKGRAVMFWGIVALFAIVAVWGLVALLNQILLGGAEVEDPDVPGITGPGAAGGVDLGDDPLAGGADGPFDPGDPIGSAPPPSLANPPAFGGP